MKFGAKLTHGFGVGKVRRGAPSDGDPEVSVNIDDFDERPDGGFDESERVSKVGMAGGKTMVEGRGAGRRRGGGGDRLEEVETGRGGVFGKFSVAPGESAGIVDNVVVEGERDVVNRIVDRIVVVREGVDLVSGKVSVVVKAVIIWESNGRGRNGRGIRTREGGGRTKGGVVAVVKAGNNLSFVGVDAHAGDLSKSVQEREGGDDVKDTGGGDGEVIGGSADFEIGCVEEFGKQSVVAENEEEGGERAALFHTALDVDGGAGGDAGRNPDVGKQVLNSKSEPRGKALFGESGKDEVMLNGVKGFPVISEKSKKLLPSTPFGVEFVTKREDMICEVATWEKHLLMTADKVLSGINDAGNEGPGDDPVVGVVDADGASVLDQVGGFLWDEDQASAVKAGDPGFAGGEGAGNVEQERAREVGELLIGFEGDAVWAARVVGGRVNGVQDDGETQGLDKKRVDTAGVVGDIHW